MSSSKNLLVVNDIIDQQESNEKLEKLLKKITNFEDDGKLKHNKDAVKETLLYCFKNNSSFDTFVKFQ